MIYPTQGATNNNIYEISDTHKHKSPTYYMHGETKDWGYNTCRQIK